MKTLVKNFKAESFTMILLWVTFSLFSQNEAVQRKKYLCGGIGHLNFSAEQLNISGLNTALNSEYYNTVNPYSVSFGGGGHYVFGRIMVGGGGAWLMNSRTQNNNNTVKLKGGYGYFSLGYLLLKNKRSLLYPGLGIGGGGYDILITKKNARNDFRQQLNSPEGMAGIEASGWLMSAQLTYKLFLSKNTTEGFCIGLRAGYRYSPYNWHTSLNNTVLANSPTLNMNGLYVSLLLGGGSVFNQ